VASAGERRSAPQRQCLAQSACRLGRGQRPRALVRLLEHAGVELAGLDPQPVAAAHGLDAVARLAERAAQPRHSHLQRLGGARRRLVTPQHLRQRFSGHGLAGVQQERGQQRPLPWTGEVDRAVPDRDVQRSKDAEPKHGASLPAAQVLLAKIC